MNKETRKVRLYVQAIKWINSKEFKIEVGCYSKTSCEHYTIIDISEVTVDVPIPAVNEKQLTQAEVKQLQAIIQKEKADSFVRITAIEERIQSLLSLEHIHD